MKKTLLKKMQDAAKEKNVTLAELIEAAFEGT